LIDDGIRYIFRRNPVMAEEIQICRDQKIAKIRTKIEDANNYLTNHPKAKTETQFNLLSDKIKITALINFVQFHHLFAKSVWKK